MSNEAGDTAYDPGDSTPHGIWLARLSMFVSQAPGPVIQGEQNGDTPQYQFMITGVR